MLVNMDNKVDDCVCASLKKIKRAIVGKKKRQTETDWLTQAAF